jgi:hypothetical protein
MSGERLSGTFCGWLVAARWVAGTGSGQGHHCSNGNTSARDGGDFDQDGTRTSLFCRSNGRSGWLGSCDACGLYELCRGRAYGFLWDVLLLVWGGL